MILSHNLCFEEVEAQNDISLKLNIYFSIADRFPSLFAAEPTCCFCCCWRVWPSKPGFFFWFIIAGTAVEVSLCPEPSWQDTVRRNTRFKWRIRSVKKQQNFDFKKVKLQIKRERKWRGPTVFCAALNSMKVYPLHKNPLVRRCHIVIFLSKTLKMFYLK